jgi:hypothetical protein
MTRKWARAGSTTLVGTSDAITVVDGLTESGKENNEHQAYVLKSGNARPEIEFNNDSGTNYARRRSQNGGADTTQTNEDAINVSINDPQTEYIYGVFSNLSAEEKLAIYNTISEGATGAGTAPNRVEVVGKWTNVASQVSTSKVRNDQAGDFIADSNLAWFTGIDQAIARFGSMREALAPLTSSFNQHFVDWFSGTALDTNRWILANFQGVGSLAMVDAINEGFGLSSGGNNTDQSSISFGTAVGQYSNSDSVMLAVARKVNASSDQATGLSSTNRVFTSLVHSAYYDDLSSSSFKSFTVSSSVGQTRTNTTAPSDTNFIGIKGELTPSSYLGSLNGTLEVTITTDLPTIRLQPVALHVISRSAGAKETRIRYMEVFNT